MSIPNVLLASGRALSLAAWFFGAIALGVGNAYFGVALNSGHVEHQPRAVGAAEATEQCHNAPSSAIPEVLPAHCLFCLDGPAAVEPVELQPLIRFSNVIAIAPLPQQQKHLGLTDPGIAQPRGPPAISPS